MNSPPLKDTGVITSSHESDNYGRLVLVLEYKFVNAVVSISEICFKQWNNS
jgi:hypothetical protein